MKIDTRYATSLDEALDALFKDINYPVYNTEVTLKGVLMSKMDANDNAKTRGYVFVIKKADFKDSGKST